ncbi:MAG: single-stranded-DNA-specific exonuclease RecJ [Verrucomicrobiota bacterium]|nr:single-stranded-DNA-specific exonuclease RecJ [Verrucomicrobiota bacterium]
MKLEWQGFSPFLADLLASRKIVDEKDVSRFFSKDLGSLAQPSEMKGMLGCTERLKKAISDKEKVLVYGDYDVDGVCASAIILLFLKLCGVDAYYFIPNRIEDGYGISADSAKRVLEENPSLVVSVDCGISALEAVDIFNDNNVDIIITDHHIPGTELPNTKYILNPHLTGESPFQFLCGAGTAFKFVWGTAQKISKATKVLPEFRTLLMELLPLATLATIADMVPLVHENRTIATAGLKILGGHKLYPGLRALKKVAAISDKEQLTSFDVGFKIGPRLNAAGRIEDAATALQLLTTDSEDKARELAEYLDEQNKIRQDYCKRTVKEAVKIIESSFDLNSLKSIVVYRVDWHKGIIGIVASKLVNLYHRPTIVLTKNSDGTWSGSARSINDFHIKNALDECSEMLLKHGGHKGAAGLTLKEESLEKFAVKFNEIAQRELTEDDLVKTLLIDSIISHKMLTLQTVYQIKELEPFGEANRKPLFLSKNLQMIHAKTVGKENLHLKMTFLSKNGHNISAIGFGMGERLSEIKENPIVDIIFSPEENIWRNNVSLDLHIKDFRVSKV